MLLPHGLGTLCRRSPGTLLGSLPRGQLWTQNPRHKCLVRLILLTGPCWRALSATAGTALTGGRRAVGGPSPAWQAAPAPHLCTALARLLGSLFPRSGNHHIHVQPVLQASPAPPQRAWRAPASGLFLPVHTCQRQTGLVWEGPFIQGWRGSSLLLGASHQSCVSQPPCTRGCQSCPGLWGQGTH